MRRCFVFAMIVAASVAGCKVNGKPVGWPEKGGGGEASSDNAGGGESPSATQVTHERPAWCDVEGAERLSSGAVKYTLEDDDVRDQVFDLTGHFCAKRPATERRDELVALHAKISKDLMMNDADWRDAVEWATYDQGQRNSPSLSAGKKALSKMDAVEQYALLAGTYGSIDFLADELDPVLTAAGRMAYVERCIRTDKVAQWAICHDDVLAFDPAKIAAEIRAAQDRSGYERTVVRLQMAFLRPQVAKWIAGIEDVKKKDPGYAKLFQVAAEARKGWKPDPAAVKIALAMADATASNSRSAFSGCYDTTWAAFSKAVTSSVPAKRFDEITPSESRSFIEKAASVALDSPAVYLSAYAMIRCVQGSDDVKPDVLVRTLGGEMAWRPGLRGPRTAAHTAALAAGIELDDRDARIEFPPANHSDDFPKPTGWSGGGHGIVAEIGERDDKVTIGFAKKMATYEECTRWKTTDRIDRIGDHGKIHYEQYCTKSVTKKYNAASPPLTVPARYASRVGKGKQISVIEDVVVEVRDKEGGDIIAVFGVPVD